MGKAGKAQLFVVGIGNGQGVRYFEILKQMSTDKVDLVSRVSKDAVAEIAWVPLGQDGKVLADIEKDLVASSRASCANTRQAAREK